MYFEELSVGMTVTTAPTVIEKERVLEFARLYDPIPLHTDEAYASTTRFGGLIAPGVMSFMAVWAKYTEVSFFGDALVAGKSTKIEWQRPVYPGDVLTGVVTITDLTRRNERNGLVTVRVDVYNQKGEMVLYDVTESVVACRPATK